MGHRFGLDSSYLRLGDEAQGQEYLKAMPALTWLTSVPNGRVTTLQEENKDLRERVDKMQAQLDSMHEIVAKAITGLENREKR